MMLMLTKTLAHHHDDDREMHSLKFDGMCPSLSFLPFFFFSFQVKTRRKDWASMKQYGEFGKVYKEINE